MSEYSEDMKALSEHFKEVRKEREATNTEIIENWCAENNVHLNIIAPHHLRLMKDVYTIDIYPQSKKYHDIRKNQRGRIKGSIITFLTDNF